MFESIDKMWTYRPVLLVVICLFFSFLMWASLSEIDQQVRGTGRIIPSGKARMIQHLEGGIVEQILIREGQKVQVEQPLFVISNQRAENDLDELKITLASYRIKQTRLQAELDNQKTVNFLASDIDLYPSIVKSEKQLFETRRSAFYEKIKSMEEKFKQKSLKLVDLNTRVKNLKEELAIAKEQLAIKKRLFEAGAMSRSRYLDADSDVKDFNTRISRVDKEIPVVIAERAEANNLLEEYRQGYNSEILDELQEVQFDIKKVRERIDSLQDQVTRTSVKSPINGIVNKLHINTVGGVVQPGAVMAEVIPVDETLIVEGQISTEDRGKVWPSLPVTVKLTAYDYTLYGGLEGTLTNISADSFLDKQNNEYYQVFVTLNGQDLGGDKPVYPGMITELNIKTGKISVLSSILRPFWEIRDNALREK